MIERGYHLDLLGVGIAVPLFGGNDERGAFANLHLVQGIVNALDHAARPDADGQRLVQVLVHVAFAEYAPLIADVGQHTRAVLF